MKSIDISPANLEIVFDIIRDIVPDIEVRAFGSRVSWTARETSDLDLVLMTKEPLQWNKKNNLQEAFSQSNLPFSVDIIDWASTSDNFREIINRNNTIIWKANTKQNFKTLKDELKMENFAFLTYGKTLSKNNRNLDGYYPVYGSNGIIDYHDKPLTNGPTIIVGRKGTVGAVHYSPVPCWPIDTTFYLTKKNDQESLRFKYYLLKSLGLEKMNSDSAVPGLNREAVHSLTVQIPSSYEQRVIAYILGSLDDKIELNRRMNDTLEEMARALFKSWFVDFDPVRAKMDGRWKPGQSLPGLPAELYDLFPDHFVPSKLGEIPLGWKALSLKDVLSELISGSRPRGGSIDSGIPSIGAENIIGLGKYNFSKEKYIPSDHYIKLQKKGAQIQNSDVLIYKDGAQIGRKTYFDCGFPHTDCAINEHVFILRSNNSISQKYVYFWLDQGWMTEEIIGLNSNSAQPGINKSGVMSLPVLAPSFDIIKNWDQIVSPLINKIFNNSLESITLGELRDTLLPKLLSGEIRVDELGIEL